MAAVLDEAMGVAAAFAGHIALAGQLKISFSSMLPLETVTTAEAWVDRVEGSKIYTCSTLLGSDGNTFAAGEGVFVEVGYERFAQLFDKA